MLNYYYTRIGKLINKMEINPHKCEPTHSKTCLSLGVCSGITRINAITENDIEEVTHLANELWPDALYQELKDEFERFLLSENDMVYICRNDHQEAIAFAHISIRYEYVEGTDTSPVGYLEGIYVKESYRKQGIAAKILDYAEQWLLTKGCSEIASDTELENTNSILFHKNSGFQEVNRLVCFVKNIR